MKTLSLLAALALFTGCTTTTTRTRAVDTTRAENATAMTPKRVYTQADLQKTGQPELGGALQTVDASVYISGR